MNWELYFTAGFYISIYVTIIWIFSLAVRDSGIMDIFWGPGFILAAFVFYYGTAGHHFGQMLLLILVSIWGLRLALYIAIRNTGKPEDARYNKWRKEAGSGWWWQSYFRVFVLQGIILWIISMPLHAIQSVDSEKFSVLPFTLGVLLWFTGFVFEVVGDWQLMSFKRISANKGKVMTSGLWAYTRHPNYFGEAVLWWGFYLISASMGGWYTIFSPMLITYLLIKVSGVAMLDKLLLETKPEYGEYIKQTPSFFPRLLRRSRNTSEL